MLLCIIPMNKPREWWIREWTDYQPDGFLSGNITSTPMLDVLPGPAPDAIHVIEKSAYDRLLAIVEVLTEQRNRFIRLKHGGDLSYATRIQERASADADIAECDQALRRAEEIK